LSSRIFEGPKPIDWNPNNPSAWKLALHRWPQAPTRPAINAIVDDSSRRFAHTDNRADLHEGSEPSKEKVVGLLLLAL